MRPSAIGMLQRRHRQVLWTPTLHVINGGLLCIGILWYFKMPGYFPLIVAVSTIASGFLLRLFARSSLNDVAKTIDQTIGGHSQLEAAVETMGKADPMSRAISRAADDLFSRRPMPSYLPWRVGVSTTLLLVALNLTILLASKGNRADPFAPRSINSDSPPIAQIPDASGSMPPVLRWILSQDTEEPARNTLTLPVMAQADSPFGFRDLELQIVVADAPIRTVAIGKDIPAGRQPITATIPLSDILTPRPTEASFHLRALALPAPERTTTDPETWVTSEPRLVRFQLPTMDIRVPAIAQHPPSAALQRRLQNALGSAVATTDDFMKLARDLFVERLISESQLKGWLAEPQGLRNRLATLVNQLAAKSSAEIATPPLAAAPTAQIDTSPPSEEKHDTSRNSPSGTERNSNNITPSRSETQSTENSATGDPSSPRQTQTIAALAAALSQQNRIAEQLSEKNVSANDVLKKQNQLRRGLVALKETSVLSPDVAADIAKAYEFTTRAAEQMNESDIPAAREPAAQAAASLSDAIGKMEKESRDRTAESLLALQNQLLRMAASLARKEKRDLPAESKQAARDLDEMRKQLEKKAAGEEQNGSSAAASELKKIAAEMEPSGGLDPESSQNQSPTGAEDDSKKASQLRSLAQEAANSAKRLQKAGSIEQRAIDKLEVIERQLRNGEMPSHRTGEIHTEVISQLQRARHGSPASIPPEPGPGTPPALMTQYAIALADSLSDLRQLENAAPNGSSPRNLLKTANIEDTPPAFRTLVEDYFERLAKQPSLDDATR